jgi:hypothetical protein
VTKTFWIQSGGNPVVDRKQEKANQEITRADKSVEVKRKFIEPEISQPVDVLEATTFFQAVDSGATN